MSDMMSCNKNTIRNKKDTYIDDDGQEHFDIFV